jgi:hypothetical protein
MNILPKFPPSSVRSGSSLPPATGTRSPEPRLYFVGTGLRRSTITPEKRVLPLFPHESEDARLTGETRSLFRRLLALNLPIASDSITVTTIRTSIEKIA